MSGLEMSGHFDFSRVLAVKEMLSPAAQHGMGVIKDTAVERVPKESTHLADTAEVKRDKADGALVIFKGPYAHWIEEGVEFNHPHGGQAKYLASAMLDKSGDAIDSAGDYIRRHL